MKKKNYRQKININFHHLIEKELADLMNQAKEAAKKAGFKYVWYGSNTILARKDEKSQVIQINCGDDLSKIRK